MVETALRLRAEPCEAGPLPWTKVAEAVGVSLATLTRLMALYKAGGEAALLPKTANSGRRPLVELTAQEQAVLQRRYLKTNLSKGCGSKSRAARRLAMDPDAPLREETRNAILYKGGDPANGPRSTKQDITRSIRRAMDLPKPLFRRHRDAKAAALAGLHTPGRLRRSHDLTRRLWAGETFSVDDGTQNHGFVIPWPWGGDPCSDRYGVRLGRYQTLLFQCHGSSYVPSREVVIRPQQSYRREDQTGVVYRFLRDICIPSELVLEGNWDVNEDILELCRVCGVMPVSARGRPHQKLVENFWNNLWTEMSHHDGMVGRYRGEHRETTELYLRCRAGRADPREHFMDLRRFLDVLDDAIRTLNHERVESQIYGKWIPAERWAADEAQFPRRVMEAQMSWMLAPVREVRQVRAGAVRVRATSPLGENQEYTFAADELWALEGRKVKVHFDPWEDCPAATILAAEPFAEWRQGDVVCRRAPFIGALPALRRTPEGWTVEMMAGDAAAVKRRQTQMVRREYQVLVPGASHKSLSDVRGPDGSRLVVDGATPDGATVEISGGRAEALQEVRRQAASVRREEVDLEDLARFEAEQGVLV